MKFTIFAILATAAAASRPQLSGESAKPK